MFEKLHSKEAVQKIRGNIYGALETLRLVEVEEETESPEPYYAIIDGRPWKFEDYDTYLAECKDNPEYSCIVSMVKDADGEIVDGECIYGQTEVMEAMKQQGFSVVDEDLVEARRNYNFYKTPGQEQASLN